MGHKHKHKHHSHSCQCHKCCKKRDVIIVNTDKYIPKGHDSSHGLISSSSLGSSASGYTPVIRKRNGKMYRIKGRRSMAFPGMNG